MSDSDTGFTLNINFEEPSSRSKAKNKVSKSRKKRIQSRRRAKINKNEKNKQLNSSDNTKNKDVSKQNQVTKAKSIDSSSKESTNKDSANKNEKSLEKKEKFSVPKSAKKNQNKSNPSLNKSLNNSTPGKKGKQKTSLFGGNPELPVIKTSHTERPVVVETDKTSFAELEDVGSELTSYLVDKMNFKEMTTVQRKSLPVLLSEDNTDVLMRSPTGFAYVFVI